VRISPVPLQCRPRCHSINVPMPSGMPLNGPPTAARQDPAPMSSGMPLTPRPNATREAPDPVSCKMPPNGPPTAALFVVPKASYRVPDKMYTRFLRLAPGAVANEDAQDQLKKVCIFYLHLCLFHPTSPRLWFPLTKRPFLRQRPFWDLRFWGTDMSSLACVLFEPPVGKMVQTDNGVNWTLWRTERGRISPGFAALQT
jgi:hypothetical protein